MSIHTIPEKFLNTTIHIFRESTLVDSVGDLATSLNLAYASLKANIQPKIDDTQFQIQGRIHLQDHVAYINRVEFDVLIEIRNGDIAYDEETGTRYTVLGVEAWQAADNKLDDTHHIKLRLMALSGMPKEQIRVTTVSAGGNII